MIKNENQFKSTKTRLKEIQAEIEKICEQNSGKDLEFWAGYLFDEEQKLEKELQDYEFLKFMTLEEFIDSSFNEPILLENVGDLLAKLRITADITQEEMAKRLGWHQSNLSRFENENYSSQTIAKIAEFVGSLGLNLYVIPSYSDNIDNVLYRKTTPISEAPNYLLMSYLPEYQTGTNINKEQSLMNTEKNSGYSTYSKEKLFAETCV